MAEIRETAKRIISALANVPNGRAMLVGVSGIDACGKGFITNKIADRLSRDIRVAVINADGWLNLPHIRLGDADPGRHFYHHALRLDEMFEHLVLPLRQNRSVSVTTDFAEETATEFRTHEYVFDDIDVILLEGIFLFKRAYIDHFDLRVWIECSFETAVSRAVARSQEGLSPEQTTAAYEQIYFPAQHLHFERDRPAESSDIIYENN